MKRYNNGTFISSLLSCDWQGDKIREPFRRGLGYAAQWLDGLRVLIKYESSPTGTRKRLAMTIVAGVIGMPLLHSTIFCQYRYARRATQICDSSHFMVCETRPKTLNLLSSLRHRICPRPQCSESKASIETTTESI